MHPAARTSCAVCQSTASLPAANVIPGCVPIDLLSRRRHHYTEMLDDLMDRPDRSRWHRTARCDRVRLRGVARSPGGSAEHVRRHRVPGGRGLLSHPDAAKRPGWFHQWRRQQSTDGSFDVSEIFFEVSVPLLREVTLADRPRSVVRRTVHRGYRRSAQIRASWAGCNGDQCGICCCVPTTRRFSRAHDQRPVRRTKSMFLS